MKRPIVISRSIARPKNAFTLIELLVVIAIIAVLAAIIFPVFAEARKAAINTQDMSNLRQIAMGALQYAADNDETWVRAGTWNDPTITPYNHPAGPAPGQPWDGWAMRLVPYVGSRAVFHSSWMPDTASYWTGDCASSNGMALTNTYAINWFLAADDSCPAAVCDSDPTDPYTHTPDGTPTVTPMRLSEIEEPSSTMAFVINQATSAYGNAFGCTYNSIETGDFINMLRWRALFHDGGNIAFADGHAKFYVAKQANSALCHDAPRYNIFTWTERGIWAYPRMPRANGGYTDGPVDLGCE